MIKEAISKAMNKENLTREEALQVMKEIMRGDSRRDFCLRRRYAQFRNEA